MRQWFNRYTALTGNRMHKFFFNTNILGRATFFNCDISTFFLLIELFDYHNLLACVMIKQSCVASIMLVSVKFCHIMACLCWDLGAFLSWSKQPVWSWALSNIRLTGLWLKDLIMGLSKISVYCTWWHHDLKRTSALLALCAGDPLATGRFRSHKANNVEHRCLLLC